MSNFIEMLARLANDLKKDKLNNLSIAQRCEYSMRLEHAYNQAVHWHDNLDDRGQMMKNLFDSLVAISESDFHRAHRLIDEDECIKKESDLRNSFFSKIENMWNAVVNYAEYLGYCDNDGVKSQMEALDKEFGIADDDDQK